MSRFKQLLFVLWCTVFTISFSAAAQTDDTPPDAENVDDTAQNKTDTEQSSDIESEMNNPPKPEPSDSDTDTDTASEAQTPTESANNKTIPLETQTKNSSEQSESSEYLDMSLSDLLNLQVTTASKRNENIRTAPSNITVITDKQIKERGYTDLQDVLRTVSGYLVLYDRDEWSYSARGNIADNNQKYLILLDGHRMNSTENFGPGQINELPMDLGNVKRLEIIKGPGSAVWGSEALAGVINIITYTGEDLGDKKYRASATYGNNLPAFKSHTGKANFQVGTQVTDKVDLILSGAFVDSKGRVINTDASNGLSSSYWYKDYCGADFCTSSDGPDDRNTAPPYGRYKTDLNRYKPSYFLQGKARVGDFTINSLFFHTQVKNRHFEANDLTVTPDGTDLDRKTWYTTDKFFLEGIWNKKLSNDVELNWKISGDMIDSQFVPEKDPALFISWKENRMLTSIDGFVPLLDKQLDFTAGADYSFTHYGPSVRFDNLDPSTTGSQIDNPDPLADSDGLITKLEDDNNLGAYALIGVHILNKTLHFTGGTRLDFNNDRGDQKIAMAPRAAVVYELKDSAAFKLVYNSGFLRPANFQRSELSVNPERMHQIELISMVDLDPISFTVTGYWQRLKGIILIANSTSSSYLGSGFTNTGDYTSIGAELDMLVKIASHDIFGNFSYAHPTGDNFDDGLALDSIRVKPDGNNSNEGRLLNYPSIMFNLGATFRFFNKLVSFTPSVRFQGPMEYRAAPPINSLNDAVYRQTNAMAFVNASLLITPVDYLDIRINAKNIFNQRGPEPISVWNGTRDLYGTYIEATLGVKF